MPGLPLKNPWTRPIPNPSQDLPNLFACVSALKETVESLIGQRGRSPNRAVTFNDLTAMGVLTQDAVTSPGGSFAPALYQAGYGIAINTGTAPPTISTAVPYLPLTGGTINGPLIIANDQAFGYGGQMALVNNAAGATNINKYFRISPVGTLELINSTFSAVEFQFTDSGDFNASGRIYANGTVFNLNSGAVTGAFHMAPNGSGTGYGSFWYNDGSTTYLLLTNNNDALGAYNSLRPFSVNDATGLVGMGHGLSLGGALQFAGVTFADQDATFHRLYDKSGRSAIFLGGTADPENYYRNGTHRFQGVGGATYDYTIDSGGITLQNGATAYRSKKTDGTQVALAYLDGSNNVIIGGYGSGLSCFVGSGGSYFSSDGNFIPGADIILKNGLYLYGANAAATGNYPLIGVASDNRIKINSSASYNVDAYGYWTFTGSIAAPDITLTGSGAIFVFADRSTSASGSWGWYATGGVARLWNSGTSDRVMVDTNGNVTIAGTYLYGYGGGGAINAAGGPFLYFDNSFIIAHCGSGNAGFRVQDKDGTIVGGFDTGGWLLGLAGRRVAVNDGNFTQIQDAAGNTAIYLGGTVDPTNYYRNTNHNFQSIGGGAAFASFTAAGALFYVPIVSGADTYPNTDNSTWCGVSGHAWSNVYSYVFVNASDVRHKVDIKSSPNGCLDLVRAIQPKRYKFNNGPSEDRDRVHWGFVAQEVGGAMRDAGHDFGGHYIADDPERTEALAYHELVAVLWSAVRELATRVLVLEEKLA